MHLVVVLGVLGAEEVLASCTAAASDVGEACVRVDVVGVEEGGSGRW